MRHRRKKEADGNVADEDDVNAKFTIIGEGFDAGDGKDLGGAVPVWKQTVGAHSFFILSSFLFFFLSSVSSFAFAFAYYYFIIFSLLL